MLIQALLRPKYSDQRALSATVESLSTFDFYLVVNRFVTWYDSVIEYHRDNKNLVESIAATNSSPIQTTDAYLSSYYIPLIIKLWLTEKSIQLNNYSFVMVQMDSVPKTSFLNNMRRFYEELLRGRLLRILPVIGEPLHPLKPLDAENLTRVFKSSVNIHNEPNWFKLMIKQDNLCTAIQRTLMIVSINNTTLIALQQIIDNVRPHTKDHLRPFVQFLRAFYKFDKDFMDEHSTEAIKFIQKYLPKDLGRCKTRNYKSVAALLRDMQRNLKYL